MSELDLSSMMSKAMDSIKGMLDIDSVIGKPVFCEDKTIIIPISKLCVGFLTGGGEIDGKYSRIKQDDLPIGGIGGGVSITPLAFLVVKNGDANLIKIEGDGVDRWMDILQSTIKTFTNKD